MVYVESQVPPRARTRLAKYLASGAFDRRDVYVITQNALAEGMYMNSIRDHYGIGRPDPERPETLKARSRWQRALVDFTWRHRGRDQAYPKDPIWIPAESDQQTAIRQYLDELRMRQPLPGEDVRVENGRVNLRGVTSVMTVNGYVAKAIFDHNKGAHTFYVEESYVIPWMYPYLEPYGIIFKINKNPLPRLTPEMVARDRAYWDALFEELRGDPRFRRDDVAQKTFSKLRSSIGGLYAFRRMSTDAEYAFQQAIALCPDSPEGNFRLAQLYVESGRFDDAVAVLAEYQKHDRYNARIRTVINTIQKLKLQSAEQRELEQQYAAQPGNIQIAQQLLDSYAAHQRVDAMDAIVSALLSHTELPAETFLQIAQRYMAVGRLDRAAELLTAMVQRYPQSREAWYNLAVVESAQRNCDETLAALERALSLDDAEHRALQSTRRDPRLDTCRQDPRFQQLLTQPARRPPPSPLLPGDVTITH
jgi:thioredoxin-like negative regulator of GroEL